MSRDFTSTMTWFHVQSITYPATEGAPIQIFVIFAFTCFDVSTYKSAPFVSVHADSPFLDRHATGGRGYADNENGHA